MPDGLRASSVLEVAWDLIPDMTGTNLLPELVGRDEVKSSSPTSATSNSRSPEPASTGSFSRR
jgi:hypothetical protein